jgi:hypothetical protein
VVNAPPTTPAAASTCAPARSAFSSVGARSRPAAMPSPAGSKP